MVERGPEKAGVVSSILTLGTIFTEGENDPEQAKNPMKKRIFSAAKNLNPAKLKTLARTQFKYALCHM